MRILVTRPAADAEVFRERLAQVGHEVLTDPLMRIEMCAPADLEARGVVAVVATSRNALRALAGHPQLADLHSLPLLAVGPGTADLAGRMGFQDIRQGAGTAADLVAPIMALATDRPRGPVLHLRGERTAYGLAGALATHGIALKEKIVYRQVASSALSEATTAALTNGNIDIIVLMSPLSAATWVKLVEAARLRDAAAQLRYACLSTGVAATVAALGAECHVAAKPSSEEMLALVTRLAAQSAGSGTATPRDAP